MAKKKKGEVLSENELQAKVYELEKEIFSLRNELAVNRKLEKPHLLKEKRREKARCLTRITQMAAKKG